MDDLFKLINEIGMIPTLSINDSNDAVNIAQSLINSSIPIMEVMLRTEEGFNSIQKITSEYPNFIVGAGTVLSVEDAKRAKEAGAKFIVSPSFNKDVATYCINEGIPIIPGCTSATEIDSARMLGLKVVKYFPAVPLGGLESITLLSGAFPTMKFIPTGGINKDILKEYTKSDKVLAVGGGFMMDKVAINNKDFATLENFIKDTISYQLNFKIGHIGINAENETESLDIANKLSKLLNFETTVKSKSIFAGNLVEVMKFNYFGSKGHIGIGTDDVPRAYAFLKRQGIFFREDTLAYDDKGKLKVAYLDEEIGGFAFHLMKNN